MASPLRSIADHMAQQNSYGDWDFMWSGRTTGPTAATVNCGSITCARAPFPLTVPTMTSPVVGAYCTSFQISSATTNFKYLLARETVMGSLTISGNSFSSGTAMGTGKYYDHTAGAAGSSQNLASYMPMLAVRTALTATTPTITITYTNQAGTGSRTATLTLPTSPAINTCFYIAPHLQSGDTGIRSVQNISTSAGSAGVLDVYGLVVLGLCESNSQAAALGFNPIIAPVGNYLIQGGDVLGFYQMGSTFSGERSYTATLSPES